jgi:hypothetical protein
MKDKELDEYKISESTKKILALRDKLSEIKQEIDYEIEKLYQDWGIELREQNEVYIKLNSVDDAIIYLVGEIVEQRLKSSLTEI